MPKPSDYIQRGWCQHASAVDRSGGFCMPNSPTATRWCLIGALIATYPERNQHREHVTTKLMHKLGHLQFARWNDDPKRTQAEVVAVLRAIGE